MQRRVFLAQLLSLLAGAAVPAAGAHANSPDSSGAARRLDQADLRSLDDPDRVIRGARDAKAKIFAFGDFTCPLTNASRPAINAALERYGDQISFGFRQLPLDKHGEPARVSAICFEAIASLFPDKAWTFFDSLFDLQSGFQFDTYETIAAAIEGAGLAENVAVIAAETSDPSTNRIVLDDIMLARRLHFVSTPSFVVGQQVFVGDLDNDTLFALIEEEMKRNKA